MSHQNYDMHIERHYGNREFLCYKHRWPNALALFNDALKQSPKRIAIIAGSRSLSYQDLDDLATRFACALLENGFQKGDRFAINTINKIEFAVAIIACLKAGIISVPIGYRHKTAELIDLYNDAGICGVLVDETTLNQQPLSTQVATLKLIICIDTHAKNVNNFYDFIDGVTGLGNSLPPHHHGEEDCVTLLYTSGTTGRSKGAMLTNLGIVHSVLHLKSALDLNTNETTIAAVPLSHVTGLIAQLYLMWGCAGTLVLMENFEPQEFVQLAVKEKLTFSILVPAMYALMLHRKVFDNITIPSWRIAAYGGATMAGSVQDELSRVVPNVSLHNAYGATETTSPATIVPFGSGYKGASVGQCVSCGEIIIVDDLGNELPMDGGKDAIGELWIKGPMIVPGYWQNSEANASAFERGYWKSGDIGRRDEQGFIFILDRKKDMINRGGYKIFSVEIENLLMEIPQIQEAALVAYSCPILGERSHAYVYMPNEQVSYQEIKDYVGARVADYKTPDRITISKTPLARNANGKIIKAMLVQ